MAASLKFFCMHLGVKILLNYQIKNEVSQAIFNNCKKNYNWQAFTKRVYF